MYTIFRKKKQKEEVFFFLKKKEKIDCLYYLYSFFQKWKGYKKLSTYMEMLHRISDMCTYASRSYSLIFDRVTVAIPRFYI